MARHHLHMQLHSADSILFSSNMILVLPSEFQYESKKRISADEAMRQPYFRSLGPRVHTLPESE